MISVKLNVVGGKHSGQVIPLDRKKFLIGREQDCQLRPNSELVSRHHCIFTVDDFSVRLRDLGSTNGTLVNGERIRKEVVLKPGDRVLVGSLEFDIQIDEVDAASETTAVAAGGPDKETVVSGADTLMEMKPIDVPIGEDTPTEEPPAPQDSQETSAQPAAPAAATPEAPAAEPPPAPEQPPAVPAQGAGDTTVIAQPIMMPGQTPYQPMMPQMGYPPMYGGYPYPGMPQQPMPMHPQQGYPAAAPGFPQQAQPVPEAPAADVPAQPEVSLPDPSETGAKDAPPPPPPEAESAEEKDGGKEEASNQSAAAIIQQHMQRRPGG